MENEVTITVEGEDDGTVCLITLNRDSTVYCWAEAFRKILAFRGFGAELIDSVVPSLD